MGVRLLPLSGDVKIRAGITGGSEIAVSFVV